MQKQHDEAALVRIHIRLDSDTIERIDSRYGETIGRSAAIRLIVRQFFKKMDESITPAKMEPLNDLDSLDPLGTGERL